LHRLTWSYQIQHGDLSEVGEMLCCTNLWGSNGIA